MWYRALPLLVLPLLAATPSAAQHPPGLRPGDRVQVESPTPGGGRVMAQVVALHPDWVAFRPEGEALVWTRRTELVDTILVSQGVRRGRSAMWGSAWGGYLGVGTGAITGILSAWSLRRGTGANTALGAAVGALAGITVGAPIGALLAREGWTVYIRPGQ